MITTLNPDQVMTAMVAHLTTKLATLGVTVRALEDKDVDDLGDIIAPPPAALVYWGGEQLSEADDNQQTQYTSQQMVNILVGVNNLRGSEEEALEGLKLVGDVRAAVAGARLQLEDGASTAPTTLLGVDPYPSKNGLWYSVNAGVNAIAQFGGQEA